MIDSGGERIAVVVLGEPGGTIDGEVIEKEKNRASRQSCEKARGCAFDGMELKFASCGC
jgi:hypothetical protein